MFSIQYSVFSIQYSVFSVQCSAFNRQPAVPRPGTPRTVLITLRVMPSAPAKPRPPWSARILRAEFRVLAELPSNAPRPPLAPVPRGAWHSLRGFALARNVRPSQAPVRHGAHMRLSRDCGILRAEFRVLAELPSGPPSAPGPTPLRIGTMRPTLPPSAASFPSPWKGASP